VPNCLVSHGAILCGLIRSSAIFYILRHFFTSRVHCYICLHTTSFVYATWPQSYLFGSTRHRNGISRSSTIIVYILIRSSAIFAYITWPPEARSAAIFLHVTSRPVQSSLFPPLCLFILSKCNPLLVPNGNPYYYSL